MPVDQPIHGESIAIGQAINTERPQLRDPTLARTAHKSASDSASLTDLAAPDGHVPSVACDRFVEIQDQIRKQGVCCQFRGFERRGCVALSKVDEL
jgi:hypothetical protein